MLSTHHLELFIAIIDAGSFSAAAASSGSSQSTVSGQLRALERDAGAVLIDRSGRSLRLTEAGTLLERHARAILAATERAVDEIDRLAQRPVAGTLRVGGTTTAGERYLPERLGQFLRMHDGVAVELAVSNTEDIVGRVFAGDLPLAVIAGTTNRPTISGTVVAHEEQIVIVAGDHPLAGQNADPDDLWGHTILVREPGSTTRRYQDELLARWRIPRARTSSIASTSGIVNAVAAGLGVACVPAVAARDAIALERVAEVHLLPEPERRPLTLIRHTSHPLNRVEELFLDLLNEGDPA
jgi:LysR family transcriptional regulator, transcriptional activator of the cysJI operon